MFAPILPTSLFHGAPFTPCGISACDRGIISIYEMILSWKALQNPHFQ
ncbi:MAG: hypothetical protein ACREA3_03560 [Nitrosotalea sp.]